MDPLHARYPFFDAAREAAGGLDASIPELAARDAPAVERGRERVERALVEGTVAPEDPGRWSARDELLSYPVARVLVSLLDDPKAVEKYATAEATTAASRFAEDAEGDDGLRSTTDASVSLDRVLREFELADAVRAVDDRTGQRRGSDRFRVDVGRYLVLSDPDWDGRWRLVNRDLRDGEVPVERDELYGSDGRGLLVAAVRRRVAEGLPFDLDDENRAALAEALDAQLSAVEGLLGERTDVGRIDAVLPELFPECIDALRERAREAELDPVEGFALLSFLAAIGMDATEATVFLQETTLSPGRIQYGMARLNDDGRAQYPPPSCETLAEAGICTNQNDHRETADHPLECYRLRIADRPPEERTDWREQLGDDGVDAERPLESGS